MPEIFGHFLLWFICFTFMTRLSMNLLWFYPSVFIQQECSVDATNFKIFPLNKDKHQIINFMPIVS